MSKTEATPVISRGGDQPLEVFAAQLGLPQGFAQRSGGDKNPKLIAAIHWMQTLRPPRQNFWPALVLALITQAEEALRFSGRASSKDPFVDFPIETHSTSGRVVNTLNFQVDGKKASLRPAYNRAMQIIRVDMRRDHPSAPAHATQAWPDYRQLIKYIYEMSPAARTRFAEYIWETGVISAPERLWAAQAQRVIRPFEKVLNDFDTRNTTPGGALFQGLVFGYFRADSPNLTLESHQVNTGSSRVDMPGDVAGFRGGEVELAVEVKDYGITGATVETVLVDFLEDLVDAPNTTAVVVADTVDDEARARLEKSNIIALSRADLRERVSTWDLPKQQEALRGALYYLGRIQKKTALVDKLLEFLTDNKISSGIIDQPVLSD